MVVDVRIGARVPRRDHPIASRIARFILWAMGWRVAGTIPDQPRFVLVGAPHTSNVDGIVGLSALMALQLDASVMIKDSAFWGPLGWLLRWIGAIPINRKSAKGVVEQSIDAFKSRERFILLIAAEGTRKAAGEWKRGFHHIAVGAQVPILVAAADYRRKTIHLGPLIEPTGDYATDLDRILDYIAREGSPRHWRRLSKPLCDHLGLEWKTGKKR